MPAGSPPCRECGTPANPREQRLLCVTCAARFCNQCDRPLPAGRKTRRCAGCLRDLIKNGPPLRSCRECAAPVWRHASRDLCPACCRRFCCRCDRRLPAGKQPACCTACQREKKQEQYQRPDRICSSCHRNRTTPRSDRCSDCNRADYEYQRAALLKAGERTCAGCPALLPAGRRLIRCAACHYRKRLERNSGKPCHDCQRRQRQGVSPYCRACAQMRQNWRRRVHKGDAAAKRVRPLAKRRKWQAASGAVHAKAG